MFVPTNDAILKWKQQYPAVATDLGTLTKMMLAGIVPAAIRSTDIVDEKTVQSAFGAKLRFNIYNVYKNLAFQTVIFHEIAFQ